MIFGREATLLIDLVNPARKVDKSQSRSNADDVTELTKRLKMAHESAKVSNKKATIRQERNYNNRVKENSLRVMLRRKSSINGKVLMWYLQRCRTECFVFMKIQSRNQSLQIMTG